jgi:Tfp pilus tip-associated adhesin PilY1
VRIGDGPPRAALLEGGIEIPLVLFEAGSRRLLWSAGAGSTAIQAFQDLDAAFTGSITAVDLDGDGLHERIYAGDMAARMWRFDLHHGADAAVWATGGIFADFSNVEGRGFLAAPDISLSATAGRTWINIAVGTAAPGNPAANNRFYVLRDHAVHASWTGGQYQDWQPLTEADLLLVPAIVEEVASAPTVDPSGPGWYVELGRGHVVVPSITVADRSTLVIASAVPRGGTCEVFARIATFELTGQRVVPASTSGQWSSRLAAPVPAGATFGFGPVAGATAPCLLADQRVPACDVDTRPRKTWWRRSDAE